MKKLCFLLIFFTFMGCDGKFNPITKQPRPLPTAAVEVPQ